MKKDYRGQKMQKDYTDETGRQYDWDEIPNKHELWDGNGRELFCNYCNQRVRFYFVGDVAKYCCACDD